MSRLDEPDLDRLPVRDVMHTGILTTDPSTPLRVVARLMAHGRVHAIAVADPGHTRRPWGIVSVLDVARAIARGGSEETAGSMAGEEMLTVSSADSLAEAARLMAEHGATHLVVVEPATGHPAGILSALDLAAAYAG